MVGVLSELAALFDRVRNVASSESTPTLLLPTSFLKMLSWLSMSLLPLKRFLPSDLGTEQVRMRLSAKRRKSRGRLP